MRVRRPFRCDPHRRVSPSAHRAMPPPLETSQRYVAGLDGIRAVAVLCVIAYHLDVPWAQGGRLGVGAFFTLSGYLITDLLLGSYRRFGNLGLGQFWLPRARRLLDPCPRNQRRRRRGCGLNGRAAGAHRPHDVDHRRPAGAMG